MGMRKASRRHSARVVPCGGEGRARAPPVVNRNLFGSHRSVNRNLSDFHQSVNRNLSGAFPTWSARSRKRLRSSSGPDGSLSPFQPGARPDLSRTYEIRWKVSPSVASEVSTCGWRGGIGVSGRCAIAVRGSVRGLSRGCWASGVVNEARKPHVEAREL
eukprot:scaffold6705_cov134-Isochrysis_galbana.AAC.5